MSELFPLNLLNVRTWLGRQMEIVKRSETNGKNQQL